MDRFTTVVFRAKTHDEQKTIAEWSKNGFALGIISGLGDGDDMTKLDRLRELAEEGMCAWDEMIELLYS